MDLGQECPAPLVEKLSIIEEQKAEWNYRCNKTLFFRPHKITKRKEYKLFYGASCVESPSFLIYYAYCNEGFRYGITATKKLGNAVIRNRCKRIVRALINSYARTNITPIRINIVARTFLLTKKFCSIEQEFFIVINKILTKCSN